MATVIAPSCPECPSGRLQEFHINVIPYWACDTCSYMTATPPAVRIASCPRCGGDVLRIADRMGLRAPQCCQCGAWWSSAPENDATVSQSSVESEASHV